MKAGSLRLRRFSFIILFLSLLISLAGCRMIELQSQWRTKEIVVDGMNSEWHESLLYIEKLGILLGFLNDQDALYACLTVSDPFQRARILREGLTVWFDPSGGNKKIWGIRFPIGRGEKLDREKRGGEREPFPEDPIMTGGEPDQEVLQETLKKSLAELEIIGPGQTESKRMPVGEAKGIEISLVPSSGLLVYELKIPLVQSEQQPYALGAQPGKAVGLGIESPDRFRGRGMGRMGGGRPGGFMGPRPGGMPGAGGFGRGMYEQPKNLKIWARVHLASAHSSE
jgi:hypothetical protein